MDDNRFFERNLLALSRRDPELCSRLKAARIGTGGYVFTKTPTGETVPALADDSGIARALHSTVNPKREAERLTAANDGETGFTVFLGLGGGFAPAAALERPGAAGALAIDYDVAGVAALFRERDYSALLGDPRFTLLVNPPPSLVESAIAELYRPALLGGVRVLPLRARVERDKKNFGEAGEAAKRGIEKVSADYSAQAHFGTRWFANIIRNVMAIRAPDPDAVARTRIPPRREAAICAAGPSLDAQIPLLLERKKREGDGGPFVICADTALPALLAQGLKPDAVVSIDCQHIGYHHFMNSACRRIPLFLDVASPPALSTLSDFPFFFAGGHPLAALLRQKWAPLPALDTSGGNVAFACLSLAESLGARRVSVYGADFSYPAGKIYAKGAYVFPFFETRQTRLSTLETGVSSLLFRAPFLPPESADGASRRETATMRAYRASFGQKISAMEAEVSMAPGLGLPPLVHGKKTSRARREDERGFTPARPTTGAADFLETYRRDVEALPPLPPLGGDALDAEARRIFATLLPLMAALKRRRPQSPSPELFEEAKRHCVDQIDRVLGSR